MSFKQRRSLVQRCCVQTHDALPNSSYQLRIGCIDNGSLTIATNSETTVRQLTVCGFSRWEVSIGFPQLKNCG
ncbi:hypothetical protein RBSWK_03132 [Rhodopirellula baltica SWK14]|uniref:Uncharacterized protein n=1 Tax=Rhodopirellula baltica SWK14 TaxID=993516 RepID=L7CHB2_RHOBT|nr:hypothetical protein RBSWK_03132 [Rhodopirellula baltica SWK14]